MEEHPELVTFGETMALLTPPEHGLLRHAKALNLSVGGAESNVAIGARRLGVRSAWIGRVGDDELGQRVLRELRGEDVAVVGIVDAEAPTGLMLKERRTQAHARVWYYRSESAGSRLTPADVDLSLIEQARVLHVTGITPALSASARETVQRAVEAARAAGTKVSLDLNFRQALWKADDFGAVMRELVPSVDIVFGSQHEIAHLIGDHLGEPEAQAVATAQLGPAQVVVKLGEHGAVAYAAGRIHRRAAFTVPVVDTVGSGDAFVAGWLSEYLRDPADVEAMLATACACGAYACTVPGDWEGSPTRADLTRLTGTGDGVIR